jgi:hypothetical protein
MRKALNPLPTVLVTRAVADNLRAYPNSSTIKRVGRGPTFLRD